MSSKPITVFLDESWTGQTQVDKGTMLCQTAALDLSECVKKSIHLVSQGFIDLVDQPVESAPIDRFGKGISGIDSMVYRERTEHLNMTLGNAYKTHQIWLIVLYFRSITSSVLASIFLWVKPCCSTWLGIPNSYIKPWAKRHILNINI